MTGPLASLATAEVLEDRTLVIRPEDANVRRALAAYVRRAGGKGGSQAIWNATVSPRRPVLVLILSHGSDGLIVGLTLPAELWNRAPRGPLRVAVEYGDATADPELEDGRLVDALDLHAPPLRS